jgi:hypothetical protein
MVQRQGVIDVIGSIGAVPMVYGDFEKRQKRDQHCALDSPIEFTRNEMIVEYKRKTKHTILHFRLRGVNTFATDSASGPQ